MSPVCGPRAREVGRPATPCENAVLLCETRDGDVSFPLRIETKRIASGEMNTWATEIDGTEGSIAFSTKLPKTLRFMDYQPGGRQAWQTLALGSQSAYPTITGAIFEFGFSDATDVGGVSGRARARARGDAAAVPLRDARGGGLDTSAVHRRAPLARGAHGGLGYRFPVTQPVPNTGFPA